MSLAKNEQVILVGDHDLESRKLLEISLRCQGYRMELARDRDDVLNCLKADRNIAAVLLGVWQSGTSGLETLREIRSFDSELPVIMMSGASTPVEIVDAMRSGASDFLGKPLDHGTLRTAIQNAINGRAGAGEQVRSDKNSAAGRESAAVRELYAMASQIGPSEAPVLIQGETGSGKEVLARYLHSISRRVNRPFVKLNCAALPSELVESELFGYERGAFTGAFQRKPGMFEQAEGGTLLLDEIGDMDFKLQAKLLQVLQDHEFQRLGGKDTVRVDVRVIAATHNDLEESIAAGKFRQDLYYRLNVVSLYVPPLRDCKEDIANLTETLLRKYSPAGSALPEITLELQQAMMAYDWPGNVRELENTVRRLLVLQNPAAIARDLSARSARKALSTARVLDLPAKADAAAAGAPILEQVMQAKEQAESQAILAALNATCWNRKRAAVLLKIDYKALLYKMNKLGLEKDTLVALEAPAPKWEEGRTAATYCAARAS